MAAQMRLQMFKRLCQNAFSLQSERMRRSTKNWGRGTSNSSGTNRERSVRGSGNMDAEMLKKRADRFSSSNKNSSEGRGFGGYGFVSRGEDNRLQNSRTERTKFFNDIVLEFMRYCGELENLKATLDELKTKARLQKETSVLKEQAEGHPRKPNLKATNPEGNPKAANPEGNPKAANPEGNPKAANSEGETEVGNPRGTEGGNLEENSPIVTLQNGDELSDIEELVLLTSCGFVLVTKKESKTTIESILSSLRKLREALLSLPPDDFTKRVFLFSIRIAASISHYQTYIPSINYLLEKCMSILSKVEVSEVTTLLCLHLSHCNDQWLTAIDLYYKYNIDNINLHDLIVAWSTKDFYSWIRIYNLESNGCNISILDMGLSKIIQRLIDCLSCSFHKLDKRYLEETFLPNGVDYSRLVKDYDCSWRLDENDEVIIKERRVGTK